MWSKAIWTGGAGICLAGLLVHSFGTNNPNALRWLALSVFAAIPIGVWIWRKCPVPTDRTVLTILGFLGYAALSMTWTPDWREGVIAVNQLTLAALLFLTLVHVERETLVKAIPLTASAAILIEIGISIYQPAIFGGLGNENFQAEFLVLTAPLAFMGAWSWRDHVLATACTFIAVLALGQAFLLNPSDAKWAGIAGLGCLTIIALRKHLVAAAVMTTAGAATLALALKGSKLTSVMERLELSTNTARMWLDNPILGSGIGSFNHQYPAYQEAHLGIIGTKVIRSLHNYAGAAHNDFIQFLAVFGVVGALIVAAIALLIWTNRHRDPGANFGLITLSIFAGLALVGFPAQNPATMILGIAALSLVTKVTHAPSVAIGYRAVWPRRAHRI